MKIAMVSLTFLPKVGGLENIMAGLAEEWAKANHDVTVFTDVPGDGNDNGPYPIVRQFSLSQLSSAVKAADVFVEANISLKTCVIGLLNRKKWFVTHHLHYSHERGWKGKLKNYLTRFCHNISCSQYIAGTIAGKGIVINNFYSPLFQKTGSIQQTKELVFLGRLVSDKGVDVLIHAMHALQQKQLNYSLTIIGNGPEKEHIEQLIENYGLKHISMSGVIKGQELVEELNKHRVMVVPSIWEEPYGVVVLEGLASGCLMVCSNKGGLPEAANGFGILYNNNDPQLLANALEQAMENLGEYEKQEAKITEYLSGRKAAVVAQQYIHHFTKTIQV